MKHWLITGVPGSGKTKTGNFLQKNYDFTHFDFETSQDFQRFTENPELFINKLKSNNNVVITWGFVPDQGGISIISYLRQNDFKMFWFDGNRIASFKAFLARGDVSEELYYLQMHRIENSRVIEKFNPVLINPFNKDDSFKNLEDIVKELEQY